MKKENITRCNCDLDTRDISAVITCLKVFKRYGFTKDLVIKDSPSGTGFHCQAWHKGKGVSKKKLLRIRKKAGDDRIRCWLDSRTTRQMGVLFTSKRKRVIK